MKQKIYQIDAFASKTFEGNPAMVCPLESWLSDETMQHSARSGETVKYLEGWIEI